MTITRRIFGYLPTGEAIYAYDLRLNDVQTKRSTQGASLSATVLTYGAILQSLRGPDGRDCVLGYDTLEPYLTNPAYFGTAIGRVANRISTAAFNLNGHTYKLPQNDGFHNLHSGPNGFEHQIWKAEIQKTTIEGDHQGETLILRHLSPDGTNGFPGNLDIAYQFTLTAKTLTLDIKARTDAETLCNPSHHSYFNLALESDRVAQAPLNISDHYLQIHAETYTPTDEDHIPLGHHAPVKDTKFDFRQNRALNTNVIDHNFVVRPVTPQSGTIKAKLQKIACLKQGSLSLEIDSTLPGLQIYTGDFIPPHSGKSGARYQARSGLAIEPQFFPDAVNQANFPAITLRVGETYSETIRYVLTRDAESKP